MITRATICQDLALASGTCGGPAGVPEPILPGALSPAELDQWFLDNESLSQRYWEARDCHPLNPCWRARLPEPGPTQPDDTVAASGQIESAITTLVDLSTPMSDELDLLDDPTGVVETATDFADSGLVAATRADVGEIVFTSATEAWVEFELIARLGDADSSFGLQIGRAVLVDGSWRITRNTMCALLSIAGQQCEPTWSVEVPPR